MQEVGASLLSEYITFLKFIDNAAFSQVTSISKNIGELIDFLFSHTRIMKSINDESISLIIQSWKVIMESITLIAQNFSQAYIRTQHSIKLAGANFGMHKSFRFRSPQRSRSPASPRHIVIAVGLGLAINR